VVLTAAEETIGLAGGRLDHPCRRTRHIPELPAAVHVTRQHFASSHAV